MVHAKHQLGLVPSKESRLNLSGDPKKVPSRRTEFLAKHKKWLQDFKQARKSEESRKEEEEKAAVDRRKRFEAYSKRMRDSIRGIKGEVPPEARQEAVMGLLGGPSIEMAARTEPSQPKPLTAKPVLPRESARAPSRESARAPSREKPAWAMTADQVEEMEEEELNDLLEFAEQLDYEKYISDLEVRQAVLAVQQRINEIRLENDQPSKLQQREELEDAEWNRRFIEQWNAVSENGPPPDYTINENSLTSVNKLMSNLPLSARSKPAPLTESNLNAHAPQENVPPLDIDETRSHASLRSAMSNTSAKSLKQVHSVRSVRAIIEKRRQRAAMAAVKEEEQDPGPTITHPQVRSYAQAEQRMNDKVQDGGASNLPYLHRNPAV
jgi:hypothetical protein